MTTKGPVFTAVVCRSEDDETASMVTQPLIEEDKAPQSAEEEKASFRRFLGLGTVTGFFIQIISLGAYAIMLMLWGDEPIQKPQSDWFLYTILSVLTQIDLCISVMIWMAFTCTMTRGGMAMVREQFQAPIRRRFVFVLRQGKKSPLRLAKASPWRRGIGTPFGAKAAMC